MHEDTSKPRMRARPTRTMESTLSRTISILLSGTIIPALLLCTVCPAPGMAAPPIRLATWNLEHLAANGSEGCRPRSNGDYARLRQHAARIDADLVALQEVENIAAVRRVFDPATYAIEVSHRPDRDLGNCRRRRSQKRTMLRTGFAIHRSRLARLGLTYRRLPDFQEIGAESRRWGTQILLRPGDGRGEAIRLLSLHLKSGCAWGRLAGHDGKRPERYQCRVLLQQRGILEEWIDDRARADERYVLLGDINRQLDQPRDAFWSAIDDGATCTWLPDPVLGRKCRPGTEQPDPDADLVLANAGTPFPYPFNPRYPYAIDHIVFDSATASRVIPHSYRVLDYLGDSPAPSDHHPVSVALRLP